MNLLDKALILVCFFGLASCVVEEDKTTAEEAPGFIDAAVALDAPASNKLVKYATEEDFLSALSSMEDSIYDDASLALIEEDCAELDQIVVKASGDTLTFEGDIDMKACMQTAVDEATLALKRQAVSGRGLLDTPEEEEEEEESSGATEATSTITEAKMKVYTKLICKGKDLSSLNGKKYSDLVNEDNAMCDGASEVREIHNMQSTADFKTSVSYGDQVITIEQASDDVSARTTATSGMCVWTLNGDTYALADGCADTSKSIQTKYELNGEAGEEEGLTSYMKVDFKGLESKNGEGAFYLGGTMDVVIGDWKGTVTNKGVDTAPSYSFTNGTLTSEGTFEGGAHIRLTGLSLNKAMAGVKRNIISRMIKSARR